MASNNSDKDYNNNNNNTPKHRIPRCLLVKQQRSPAPKRRTDFSSFFPSSSTSPSSFDPDKSLDRPASEDSSPPSTATAPSTEDYSRMVTAGAPDLPLAPSSLSEEKDGSGEDMDEQSDRQTSRHKSKQTSEVSRTLLFNAKKSEGDGSVDEIELICALPAASCIASDQRKQKSSSKADKKKRKSSSIKESSKRTKASGKSTKESDKDTKESNKGTKESGKSNTDKKAGVKLEASASPQKEAKKKARRLKIMRQLGLAPPAGSPFVRSKSA